MKTRPLGDRVIVKLIEAESTTASGIVIPDSAIEKPTEGVVMAVGPGLRRLKGELQRLDVLVGDHVLLGRHSGTPVKIEGGAYIMVHEEEIFAVIDESQDADPRDISVLIFDRQGEPVTQVDIGVRVNGEDAGVLSPAGRPGPYSVVVFDQSATVELGVSAGGRMLARQVLKPDQAEVRFVVDKPRRLRHGPQHEQPIARCPDGSTGSPCVICMTGKLKVRICV